MVDSSLIPDYSAQAAAELRSDVAAWSACAQRMFERPGDVNFIEELLGRTQKLANIAKVLGYGSLRFGMIEITQLLRYWIKNSLTAEDESAAAEVLLQVGDELQAVASLPASQARRGSPLSWLSVADNCRACQHLPALSKDVVAAAGIALPSKSKKPIPAKQDCVDFQFAIQSVRKSFARQLMSSLRRPHSVEELAKSSRMFLRLADACQGESRLSALEPLFRSTGVVMHSVVEKPELFSIAVQKLFARLERYLAELSQLDIDVLARMSTLVPDEVLRQLLFCVARFPNNSADARKLRKDFGLDVLAIKTQSVRNNFAAESRLRQQVLQQIDAEIDELQAWMSQAATDPNHKRAKKLFKRLGEQQLAAGILGFDKLEAGLGELRQRVRKLKASGSDEQWRLHTAEQVLQVRDLLAKPSSVTAPSLTAPSNDSIENRHRAYALSTGSVDGVAAKLRNLSRKNDKNHFQAMAATACLHATQAELRRTESEVLALFSGNPMMNASADDVAKRLEATAKAVSLLPLPEVVPLINGLADAVRTEVGKASALIYRENFAESLVALDLYIDSMASESKSLTPLLQRAVTAMKALSKKDLRATDAVKEAEKPDTAQFATQVIADLQMGGSSGSVLDVFLTTNQSISPWLNGDNNEWRNVLPALEQLSGAAKLAKLNELHALVSGCSEYVQRLPQPIDAKDVVSETLLVVPQMLHEEPGSGESVRGLDALMARLLVSQNDPLDSTLQDVFARECATHIETLRNAIRVARADLPLSKLPSDEMLRALHTLSGCTQTVDAKNIVAIVQPLQRAALRLQRSGINFSAEETDFIATLADTIEERLYHFQNEAPVSQSALDAESQLPQFVAEIMARTQLTQDSTVTSALKQVSPELFAKSNVVEPTTSGLSSIFRAEADDLMLRLRSHTSALLSDGLINGDDSNATSTSSAITAEAKIGALRVLHTIKGSARMSGNNAMADAAHELESDVMGVGDAKEFGIIIRSRLPKLQQSLTSDEWVGNEPSVDASVESTNTPKLVDDELFSEALPDHSTRSEFVKSTNQQSLEGLMQTGTALVSRQAEVESRIASLCDHIRDIQASADRLQRLATDNPAFDSAASRELVADIQVAQRHVDQSLRELQHVQGLASRSGTSLHRALVQSRLKTVDSLLPRLEASLADAITVCKRDANLLLTGGELSASVSTLNAVAPLLEQLIRNAVAHGIDTPAVREAEHKPADGEVAITVRVDGTDLLIDVSDDGDGVDEDVINQQRYEQGLPPISGAQQLREILCTPGYSTLVDVTPVAGRGQGLAMVLDGVEALSGELSLINDPGEGLTVRLRVPQSMVVAQSLVFGEGPTLHAIPVGYIAHIASLADEPIIEYQNQLWPVCTIEQLMGLQITANTSAESCALVNVAGENLAIPLPSLSGYKELIVQSVGAQLQSLERYVGGAVLSDGRQALILNLHRLMQQRVLSAQSLQAASASTAVASAAHYRAEPYTALIADDSVTMRVAGERLLQRLGFQVHTARDGLEALDFLQRSLPSVLLLDIEMPGADGFDVVRRMRQELVASEVPVIIISTRRGPEERERARSLGIQHLIHKPYTETQLREALEEVGVFKSVADAH